MQSDLLAYEQRLARLLQEQELASERMSMQNDLLAMAAQDTCESPHDTHTRTKLVLDTHSLTHTFC